MNASVSSLTEMASTLVRPLESLAASLRKPSVIRLLKWSKRDSTFWRPTSESTRPRKTPKSYSNRLNKGSKF
jgi:hypothetical protein